jgi:hypothetical protein
LSLTYETCSATETKVDEPYEDRFLGTGTPVLLLPFLLTKFCF